VSSKLDPIVTRFVLLLLLPLALLPLRLARAIGAGAGLTVFRCSGKLRCRVVDRITESLPAIVRLNSQMKDADAEAIGRRFFANLGRFFSEVVKIHYGLGRGMLENVEFRGMDHYRQAKDAGRGVIFVTAHCGNWEASALAFGLRHDPLTVVVRHQRSATVTTLLQQMRTRYGNESTLKDGVARRVLRVVRSGGVVGILSDIAVPQREGILTDFLGRPAWTTPMPAVIAQKTGCALLPGFIHRDGQRLLVDFFPQIETEGLDTATITAHIASSIELQIARHPDEWFWLYHRWRRAPASSNPVAVTDN
jgi:Kdo2-lipid IVA lauroyltransferase/acyltransferase